MKIKYKHGDEDSISFLRRNRLVKESHRNIRFHHHQVVENKRGGNTGEIDELPLDEHVGIGDDQSVLVDVFRLETVSGCMLRVLIENRPENRVGKEKIETDNDVAW